VTAANGLRQRDLNKQSTPVRPQSSRSWIVTSTYISHTETRRSNVGHLCTPSWHRLRRAKCKVDFTGAWEQYWPDAVSDATDDSLW